MQLTTEQQQLVELRVNNERKSEPLAYFFWFFLGWLGAHRFYLGDPKTGAAIPITTLLGGGLLAIAPDTVGVLGGVLLFAVGLWLIIDAFLIPGMIRSRSSKLRKQFALEATINA